MNGANLDHDVVVDTGVGPFGPPGGGSDLVDADDQRASGAP